MGKASSAKKIARAQRAGATTGPSEHRHLGFPAMVTLVIVLGLALVVFARATRDAQASPTLQDHWHNAYGVYNCQTDSFLDPFMSEFDPEGIHSHQDGVIHIHPFTASVTGNEAKMSVFMDAMGATLTDSVFTLPGGETLEAGVDCGGEPAILQVVRWESAQALDEPADVATEDLGDYRFVGDGQVITIALAPEGADIPTPPSLDDLEDVRGQYRAVGVEPPNTSAIPGPQDFGLDSDE